MASPNDFVGQFTLPFSSLKQGGQVGGLPIPSCLLARTGATTEDLTLVGPTGYRHIHLLSKDGAPLSPATLFVHICIQHS